MYTDDTRLERHDPAGVFVPLQHYSPLYVPSAHQFEGAPESTAWLFVTPGFTKSFERRSRQSGTSRKNWNNFEHYKMSTAVPSSDAGSSLPVYVRPTTCGHTYYGQAEAGLLGWGGVTSSGSVSPPFAAGMGESSSGYYFERPEGGFIPTPAAFDELVSMAHKSIFPALKQELSLINSIIELKDFKTLKSTVVDVIRSAHRLDSYRKFANLRTLRQLARVVAGNYLQFMFNFRPLVSDINGIFASLSKVEGQLNDLITRAGRPQKRHFRFVWSEFSEITSDTQTYLLERDSVLAPSAVYESKGETLTDPSEFHVEIEFNFNFTQYQLEHARVLALLDKFGVNLNPTIIWNAIPWSFVVDWLASVSSWLDQFKVQNMAPQINIRRALWSIKRKRKWRGWKRCATDPFIAGFAIDNTWKHVMDMVETSYRRENYVPSRSSIISSGLTDTEVSLGAALVIAQRRRPRRRV